MVVSTLFVRSDPLAITSPAKSIQTASFRLVLYCTRLVLPSGNRKVRVALPLAGPARVSMKLVLFPHSTAILPVGTPLTAVKEPLMTTLPLLCAATQSTQPSVPESPFRNPLSKVPFRLSHAIPPRLSPLRVEK